MKATFTIFMFALAVMAPIVPAANAQANYTVLHTFAGSPDGTNPSPLIRDAEGNLYGTGEAGAAAPTTAPSAVEWCTRSTLPAT